MRASRFGWLLISTAVALYVGCGGDDSGDDPAAPAAGAGGRGGRGGGDAGSATETAGAAGSAEGGAANSPTGGQGGNAEAPGGGGAGGQLMEPAEIVIASDQAAPTGLALDADFVYWANHDSGSIVRCPLSGCGAEDPTELVSGQGGIRGIDVDDTSIYWISDQEVDNVERARKCPLGGCTGEPEVLVELSSSYYGAVHVVGDVFFYGAAPNFGSCPTDGCLVSGQVPLPYASPVTSMDSTPQYLYTAKYGWGEVHRCELPDCSLDNNVILVTDAQPLSVAVDETWLYFALYDFGTTDLHQISRCPLDGCDIADAELVQGGDISPYAIALSDTRLFFTNFEQGTVISIAK